MSVVREIKPETDLFSTCLTISYGAFHSSRPETVSVSCASQLTTTSVSRSIIGVISYFFALPYDVLLNSRTSSVDVFPSGIMPAYFPRRSLETFRLDFEDFCIFLRDFIASFKVEGILTSSFIFSLTKARCLVNWGK
ncbi:hypothetical protein BMS3Abin10_00931 [bacterium BMS3Abin10]|nr:hypothetical protein BMS3Abin10_00931 [bacterium BMS3Abin10]GBE39649.1 hypothetical protein BMS3Bbin08_02280 [bacterium BMS3Bbin08]